MKDTSQEVFHKSYNHFYNDRKDTGMLTFNVNSKWSLSKSGLLNNFYKRIEKKTLRRNANVIANSTYLKDQLIKSYKLAPSSIEILYQSINLKEINQKSSEGFGPVITVLFVKNDFQRGGLADLLAALKILSDTKFELTIAGCRPELDMFSVAKNIKANVIGPLPHKAILDLYQTHDIFCVPSRKEALGVANIEAMASGTAVVTTDIGGIKEVVTPNEGWVARAKSPESLADQIHLCIQKTEERKKKQSAAKIKAESFSKEIMVDRLYSKIEQLVHERKN